MIPINGYTGRRFLRIFFDLEAWAIQEHESHIRVALKQTNELDT
jgi:hypothetical protein